MDCLDWRRFSPGLLISITIKSCPNLRILKFNMKNGRIVKWTRSRNILYNFGLDTNENFNDAIVTAKEIKDSTNLNDCYMSVIEKGFQILNFETKFSYHMLNLGLNSDNSLTVGKIFYGPSDVYLRAISFNLKKLEELDISSGNRNFLLYKISSGKFTLNENLPTEY